MFEAEDIICAMGSWLADPRPALAVFRAWMKWGAGSTKFCLSMSKPLIRSASPEYPTRAAVAGVPVLDAVVAVAAAAVASLLVSEPPAQSPLARLFGPDKHQTMNIGRFLKTSWLPSALIWKMSFTRGILCTRAAFYPFSSSSHAVFQK